MQGIQRSCSALVRSEGGKAVSESEVRRVRFCLAQVDSLVSLHIQLVVVL